MSYESFIAMLVWSVSFT